MIENGIMKIRWYGGKAEIYLDGYFPTSKKRCRRLFKKLILLDSEWPQITKELIRYLNSRLREISGYDSSQLTYRSRQKWKLYRDDINVAKEFMGRQG